MFIARIASESSVHGNRETAVGKILNHNCGCVKYKCLAKDNDRLKPCTRSCAGCKEAIVIDACAKHAGALAEVRDRIVTGFEYVN